MDWETADPQEMREYLTDDLLLLKHAFDNSIQIHLSWEPAGDPQGRFVLKVIDDDKKKPRRTYSTRSVEEVVDWIEKACIGEM